MDTTFGWNLCIHFSSIYAFQCLLCGISEEGDTTAGGKSWEEEDKTDKYRLVAGIDFQGISWGERALSIAQDVLLELGDNMKISSFKVTPPDNVCVNLDKSSDKYGFSDREQLECYSDEYKKRLDVAGALGEIPDGLIVEVLYQGSRRIIKDA
ncbi:Ribosome maturation factor rimP [Quillaja saponaria]|uniref:Ribosome maturation factor rimP n=1 Tax=Quillaja saponaria TaxID=32244 RepID=A0AAD7L964_QUISA|nr:Ribosome maturation factor rimP [Quillaja saponaria]